MMDLFKCLFLKVCVEEEVIVDINDMVDCLMGNKLEVCFCFIQDNVEFVEDFDI